CPRARAGTALTAVLGRARATVTMPSSRPMRVTVRSVPRAASFAAFLAASSLVGSAPSALAQAQQKPSSQTRKPSSSPVQPKRSAASPADTTKANVAPASRSAAYLVRDILQGVDGSEPADLTPLHDVVVFSAGNKRYGRELWRTDGT